MIFRIFNFNSVSGDLSFIKSEFSLPTAKKTCKAIMNRFDLPYLVIISDHDSELTYKVYFVPSSGRSVSFSVDLDSDGLFKYIVNFCNNSVDFHKECISELNDFGESVDFISFIVKYDREFFSYLFYNEFINIKGLKNESND